MLRPKKKTILLTLYIIYSMEARKKGFYTLEDLTSIFKSKVGIELDGQKSQNKWPKKYPISRATYFRIEKGDILTYEKCEELSKHFNFGTPLIYI